MIVEILFVFILGVLLGCGLFYLLLKFKFFSDWFSNYFRNSSVKEVLADPKLLKKRLEENGELIDMGEKISVDIVKNEEGKEVIDFSRSQGTEVSKKAVKGKKNKKGKIDKTAIYEEEDY